MFFILSLGSLGSRMFLAEFPTFEKREPCQCIIPEYPFGVARICPALLSAACGSHLKLIRTCQSMLPRCPSPG